MRLSSFAVTPRGVDGACGRGERNSHQGGFLTCKKGRLRTIDLSLTLLGMKINRTSVLWTCSQFQAVDILIAEN